MTFPDLWRRLTLRQAALFVVVAGVTAAIVVVVGWQLGLDRGAEAALDTGEPEQSTALSSPAEETCRVTGIVFGGGGTVSKSERVACGETVTLTATAKEGYCFSHWAGEEPSIGCPRTDTRQFLTTAGTYITGVYFKAAPAMTLALSAPPICDVWEPGRRNSDSRLGNWYGGGEVKVNWSIDGGKAPYTITIDDEPRDGSGAYAGQSGTVSVSCALKTGEVRYEEYGTKRRTYPTEPTVDSGVKTIFATVTDADGLTAEAVVEVYAVLNGWPDDFVLRAGGTYRIKGFLVTIPAGLDMEVGWEEIPSCAPTDTRCVASITLLAHQNGYTGAFSIGLDDGTEVADRAYWRTDAAGGFVATAAADDPGHQLDAKFDELAAKLGQEPDPTAMRAD